MWVAGLPDAARVIVQGQDFVREGQKVDAVNAARRRTRIRRADDTVLRARSRVKRRPMSKFIDYAISHARLTVVDAASSCCSRALVAYVTIPKEAEPDVKIPIIYVQLTQRGISPEDAERLLLRPLETQLKSVSNVKEMRSTAFEGGGYRAARVRGRLRFQGGARRRARQGRSTPSAICRATWTSRRCSEVNLSLYPVLVVALSGDVPERIAAADRPHRQERHRAGARRARGRTARRARRGGRDHRRADAADAATASRSISSISVTAVLQHA